MGVYKKKRDKKCLKNYRLISLLKVDYKIIARVMANRLKLPNYQILYQMLKHVVLTDTLVSVRDIIDLVEMNNLEGYIVTIDKEKVFDRVSHDYFFDFF